jgi:hypothetical protein
MGHGAGNFIDSPRTRSAASTKDDHLLAFFYVNLQRFQYSFALQYFRGEKITP